MPPRGQLRGTDEHLSAERLALVNILKELLGLLRVPRRNPTQLEVATRLKTGGYVLDSSAISRYLNGERLPSLKFVAHLHRLACEDAGASAVPVSIQELERWLEKAKAVRKKTTCSNCLEHHREARSLRAEVLELRKTNEELEAGTYSAAPLATPLPVPAAQGDRQRSELEPPSAPFIATESVRLLAVGQAEAALTLVREIPVRLSLAEGAASLLMLRRQREDLLAETLVQFYSRDQDPKVVMRFVLELQDSGLEDDARLVLEAAVS